MLVIRTKQIAALQRLADDDLAADLVRELIPSGHELRSQFSEDRLFQEARDGISRARSLGLGSYRDLIGFVRLLFLIGFHFDSVEPVHTFLIDSQIAPKHRFVKMIERMEDTEWIRIRNLLIPESTKSRRVDDNIHA